MEVGPLPSLSGNADRSQRKRVPVHAFLLGSVSWIALPDDRELDDGKTEWLMASLSGSTRLGRNVQLLDLGPMSRL